MEIQEIKKLATLARIDMTEEELSQIAKDFGSILSYVDQIKEFSLDSGGGKVSGDFFVKNVVRDDVVTNEPGSFTSSILENAPNTEDGFIKVKQIF